MKKLIIVLFIGVLTVLSLAQSSLIPQLMFEKQFTFGGNRDYIFSAIYNHNTDNYIVSGRKMVATTPAIGQSFAQISSFSKNGDLLWEYTDAESTKTWWNALALAPDGIFYGMNNRYGSSILPSISKISNNGNFVWTKYLEQEFINAITANNEFLVALQGAGNLKVSIFDLDGEQTFDPWYIQLDVSYGLIIKDSSLYILGDNPGGIQSNVHSEIFKTDLYGNVIWQDSLIDMHSLRGTIDMNGDLFVSGFYYTGNSRSFYRTVKYDTDTGARIWEKLWDGDNPAVRNNATVQSVLSYPNGGCTVVGYLAKIGANDANSLDGGSIAYSSDGEVLFKIRYNGNPDFYRTSFSASLFDDDNNLVMFGETREDLNFNTASQLFLTKWDNVTPVEDEDYSIPSKFSLSQNYPNPFNPTTTINYQIVVASPVTLKVYDVLGSEVAILVNEEKPAGLHSVAFNAANLPSGTYFYRLQANNFIETKKMVLIR